MFGAVDKYISKNVTMWKHYALRTGTLLSQTTFKSAYFIGSWEKNHTDFDYYSDDSDLEKYLHFTIILV